ncbi:MULTISPECIES: hypothetical protein [unclassified Streptomyces]|uniref:hypothetical protein n=1 Tax=unclassified Streptomyces TaxID=2593676 RepID=UPI0022505D96|nr:hypothetical protein [Streptomyces sp. NBC_00340]MCX5134814.1 hypothetical protein [Streptomyces sp. NBC_00340]
MASTVVGGAIATASAGLLDHRRWRRERGDQHTDQRRTLYVSYLTALACARHSCRVAVRDRDLDAQQRRHAVWGAFEACTALRYEVSICAPRNVVKPADDAFRRLRDLRDVVAHGFSRDSDPYIEGRLHYDQAYQALRDAMRHDLGADA